MERLNYGINYQPTIKEIFTALTDEESSGDWDAFILAKADCKDKERVRDVLRKGWPLNEVADYLDIML